MAWISMHSRSTRFILAEFSPRLAFSTYIGLSVLCTLVMSLASWTWNERRFVSAKPA